MNIVGLARSADSRRVCVASSDAGVALPCRFGCSSDSVAFDPSVGLRGPSAMLSVGGAGSRLFLTLSCTSPASLTSRFFLRRLLSMLLCWLGRSWMALRLL